MKACIGLISTLPKSLETDVEVMRKAGFKNVEVTFGKVEDYLKTHTVDELRALFDNAGLKVVSAIGLAPESAGLFLAKGSVWEKYKASLVHQFELCQAMGCDLIGIGADPAKYTFDGWEKNAEANVREAAELAAEYGVRIGLESMYLNPPTGPFVVDSIIKSAEMAYKYNLDNVGFFLDLFHMYNAGDGLAQIRTIDVEKLYNIHFMDVRDMAPGTLEDSDRVLPGEGILPLDETLGVFKRKGYDGYLSLELLNEEIWAMDADLAAQKCADAMSKYVTL